MSAPVSSASPRVVLIVESCCGEIQALRDGAPDTYGGKRSMGRRRDAKLRSMYPGGRADARALRWARWWARIIPLGVLPRRWVVLEVPGRRSGTRTRFPLGMADLGGNWYLVSMLGECNWVRNVRAAGGRATLRGRHGGAVHLVDIPAPERASILKQYVRRVPGSRPHVAVGLSGTLDQFAAIAASHPTFRVEFERGR